VGSSVTADMCRAEWLHNVCCHSTKQRDTAKPKQLHHHHLDTGIVFRIRQYLEIQKVVNGHKSSAYTDSPHGSTGKTCLGRGMHCASASSYLFFLRVLVKEYRDSALLITSLRTFMSSSYPKCTSCRQEGHIISKTLHQQNPPVFSGGDG